MCTVTATTATNFSQPAPLTEESYECSQEEQIKEKLFSKMKEAVDEIFRPGYTKERKEAIEKHCLKMDTDDFLDGTLAYEVEKLGCVKKVALAATNVLLRKLKQEQIQYRDSSSDEASSFDETDSSSPSYFPYYKEILGRIHTLKDIHFPCNEGISESTVERALSIQKQVILPEDCLYVLLNDGLSSQEFNQIVRSLSSKAFVRLLLKTYKKAQEGDGVSIRNFCLFCVSRYEYERDDFCEVVTLEKAEEFVKDCLSIPPKCLHRLIEDLTYPSCSMDMDCSILLQVVSKPLFYSQLDRELGFSSFEEWPGKRKVIVNLLYERIEYARFRLLEVLLKSEDTKTVGLGKALLEALDPNMNPRGRIVAFNTIKESLSDLDGYTFQKFFGFFHTYEKPLWTSATRHERVCYVHDVEVKRAVFNNGEIDTLLTTKLENGKDLLIWEIKLNQLFQGQQVPWHKGILDLYMSGSSFGVVLIGPGDQSLYHLDLETGLLLHKIALPAVPIPKGKSEWDPCSKLHLTNSGFCYYSTIVQDKEILFGGHLREGVWQNCFERPIPLGRFSPGGPFVSFSDDREGDQLLTIIDPSNAETVIPHCFDVKIQDGNLYKIIEKNAAGKKERFFSIQPYESNFQKTFSLPDSPAREISISLYIDEIYSIRKGRITLRGGGDFKTVTL